MDDRKKLIRGQRNRGEMNERKGGGKRWGKKNERKAGGSEKEERWRDG